MGLRIATNVQSLAAQRFLNVNRLAQNLALERLSSGSRINRAGDDAAGLAISEKLRASIRSLRQANRNAGDGISLIQTAEGAMNEISNMLIRLRELSIQAASDTIGPTERSYTDKEIQNLKAEIQRISDTTEFNGTKLLNGTGPVLEIQIGMNNDPIGDRLAYMTPQYNTTVMGLGIMDVHSITKEGAQMNLSALDYALTKLNEGRASLGALQNRLQSTMNNLTIYRENLENANSRIRDTDFAEETSELTKMNILSQTNIAALSQANQNSAMALKLLS